MSCAENNGSQNQNSSTIEAATTTTSATITTLATGADAAAPAAPATCLDFKYSVGQISTGTLVDSEAASSVDVQQPPSPASTNNDDPLVMSVKTTAASTVTDMLPPTDIVAASTTKTIVAEAAVEGVRSAPAATIAVCTTCESTRVKSPATTTETTLVTVTEMVICSVMSATPPTPNPVAAAAMRASARTPPPLPLPPVRAPPTFPLPLPPAPSTKSIASNTTHPAGRADDAPATQSSSAKAATAIAANKPPIPLPKPSFTSATAGDTHLPHISSDPTLGVQLRGSQQQQKMKSYHDAKQITVWGRDSIGGAGTASASAIVIKSETVSASASPNMGRKSSDSAAGLPRRVSFPKSDHELVTGYLEPANPWEHATSVKSISEIAELYVISCQKHKTKPLPTILDHLKAVELNKQQRQPVLSLKSMKLVSGDCEALEEIFKRVQYKFIDLSSCDLNESALVALFEMIEYYEATNELDISSNSRGMTHRGWTNCICMLSRSEELQMLIAQGNPISKQCADNLGTALCTSKLHTIKLEHCGLNGALIGFCFKLRHNRVLKELWLAHNDLDCKDAEAIADLLKVNHYIELIDISNNNIRDEGLLHIVEALILQSRELERRSMLHRATAIDDDDSLSSMEVSQTAEMDISDSLSTSGKSTEDDDTLSNGETTSKRNGDTTTPDNICDELQKVINDSIDPETGGSATIVATVTKTPGTAAVEENDADDDTDDTVKSTNLKNATLPVGGGQSMLDKLLSMNSESSSEEGASNLSTDTIAACCSEDASIISDDIFDASATATITTNTQSSAHVKAPAETTVASTCVGPPANNMTNRNGKSGVEEETVVECGKILIDIITLGESEATAPNDNSSISTDVNNSISIMNSNSNNTPAEGNIVNNNNNNNNNSSRNCNSSNSSGRGHSSGSGNSSGSGDDLDNPKSQNNSYRCAVRDDKTVQNSENFEFTAGEADCLIGNAAAPDRGGDESSLQMQQPTKAVDVNKNTKLGDDYDDTHSTDSAFESASEGDISRHLPDDFSRLSSSFDGTRMDDIVKGVAIETGTIVTESTEFLADAATTPTSTPTPPSPPLSRLSMQVSGDEVSNCCTSTPAVRPPTPMTDLLVASADTVVATATLIDLDDPASESSVSGKFEDILPTLPKVTIAEDSLPEKNKETDSSPIPTPPPPSTSPGGASHGMRRTESSAGFLTNATRNRSQSSDSLCSDNSLDGSISSDLNFSASSQLNEKLTKNDTLTRQQRQLDPPAETTVKSPSGLKALALWSNNLTKDAGLYIADLLAETTSLELLNIGKNCLSNDFVTRIKDSLTKNTTLTTLGLQSAHLSANGIETLASILTFGGNSTLQRLDIRDNKLEVESLTKIAEVLKSNTTITQIDIDDEPKRLSFERLRLVPHVNNTPSVPVPQESVGSDAHLDYTRVLENVRSMCSRNEKTQAQLQTDKAAGVSGASKRRGGYYVGSRKISLTCHTQPLIKTTVVTAAPPATNNKLEVKRKTGARLRSPVPSPPTISPSSSPNRSRFQVFRVNELSPLTSPLAQTSPSPPPPTTGLPVSASSASLSTIPAVSYQHKLHISTSFPSSSSLPSMATVTSSTQSIKRMSVSPRSRFHVSKIYEDPRVPLANRLLPPITPPLNLPPTPLAKHSSDSDFLTSAASAPAVSEKPTEPQDNSNVGVSTTQASTNINTTATAVVTTTGSGSSSTNDLSHTTNQDSTNATTATTTTTTTATTTSTTETAQTQNNNTLSPLCSSSSSSSSSSTSPASLQSSSSTSSSSPLSTIFSSSSSGSSLTTDHTDSSDPKQVEMLAATLARCPIAVFTDNDITLTKNSACEFASPPASGAASASPCAATADEAASAQAAQQRVRKVSWMANPGAVDKLCSLFHNSVTMFQRSSSPDNSVTTSTINTNVNTSSTGSSTSQTIHLTDCSLSGVSPQQQQQTQLLPATQQQNQHNSLISTRKNSPPSWTKLGTEILSASSTGATNTTVTTAAAATLEQSRSFLDVASRQLRDLGKQVFRQNLTFGNEVSNVGAGGVANVGAVAGVSTDSIAGGDNGNGGSNGNNGGNGSPEQHDATLIPTDVKQEIKENISPEHTINEETLHSLQKLSGGGMMAELLVAGRSSMTELTVRDEQESTMGCVVHTEELGQCDLKEFATAAVAAAAAAAAAAATTATTAASAGGGASAATTGEESPPPANAI